MNLARTDIILAIILAVTYLGGSENASRTVDLTVLVKESGNPLFSGCALRGRRKARNRRDDAVGGGGMG